MAARSNCRTGAGRSLAGRCGGWWSGRSPQPACPAEVTNPSAGGRYRKSGFAWSGIPLPNFSDASEGASANGNPKGRRRRCEISAECRHGLGVVRGDGHVYIDHRPTKFPGLLHEPCRLGCPDEQTAMGPTVVLVGEQATELANNLGGARGTIPSFQFFRSPPAPFCGVQVSRIQSGPGVLVLVGMRGRVAWIESMM